MCVRCLCFFGHCVLIVISLSSLVFPNFTLLYPVCQRAWMLAWSRHTLKGGGGGWCSERTVMSGMWGGAVEGANVPKSCISFGVETSHFDFFQHHFCSASVHLTIFQKHKRKSSFVSSGKRYSLVGISFHCPRTICLLKQEDQRAKTHFEETLRFLRTDSVWICQLFCNLATVCSTKGTFHEKIPTLSVC